MVGLRSAQGVLCYRTSKIALGLSGLFSFTMGGHTLGSWNPTRPQSPVGLPCGRTYLGLMKSHPKPCIHVCCIWWVESFTFSKTIWLILTTKNTTFFLPILGKTFATGVSIYNFRRPRDHRPHTYSTPRYYMHTFKINSLHRQDIFNWFRQIDGHYRKYILGPEVMQYGA
jgi:hypothetical protein